MVATSNVFHQQSFLSFACCACLSFCRVDVFCVITPSFLFFSWVSLAPRFSSFVCVYIFFGAKPGPKRPRMGENWAKPGRKWSNMANNDQQMARKWSTVANTWPTMVNTWSNMVENGQRWSHNGQKMVKQWSTWLTMVNAWSKCCHKMAKHGQTNGQKTNNGQIW